MKIEKLTDNKIRIILYLDDLSKKNMNVNSLSKNKDDFYILFKSILVEAEKRVGFKVNNCKLFIESFSSPEGYLVLTLTKYKNELGTNKRKLKLKATSLPIKNAMYLFNDFEEFCNFCTYCSSSKLGSLKNFSKRISLYEFNGLYYLAFSGINNNFKYCKLFYDSISEFSSLVSYSNIFMSNLNEHGKTIFKNNAIEKGIHFFVKI